MAIFQLRKPHAAPQGGHNTDLEAFLAGYSIEVMPKTAEKISNFRDILPAATRVYVAHIQGTQVQDMVSLARRLRDDGFHPMPHIPARLIKDEAALDDLVSRYANEAGVEQALILAGSPRQAEGAFDSSMQLLETGVFDKAGFKRLHVAGHPEGNRDIDPDGSDHGVMQALRWKQDFSNRTDASLALVTQFCFAAEPVIKWVDAIQDAGVDLPVHIGIAGPAKLQTLIKFAVACGVGPSLKVLQKRALDVTKLILPFEPTQVLNDLAAHKAANPNFGIEQVHFFPLGGIATNANWAMQNGGKNAIPANAA